MTQNRQVFVLFVLVLSNGASAMLFPELRVCNYTRNTVAYQVLAVDQQMSECSPWNRLEADVPYQCQTVKLFDGPCQTSTMDSVRVLFDSDRYGRCVIPFIKVTSPGKIDVFVERAESDTPPVLTQRPIRLPMMCRWLYH